MAELAFYRHKHGKLLDHCIGWLTLGKYSHVEFVLSENPLGGDTLNSRASVSSSWRDGGVRSKRLSLDNGKWTRYRVNPDKLALDVELSIAEWLDKQRGKKYDTLGVLLTPFSFWKKKVFRLARWFCSEICTYVFRNWGIYNFPTTQISPSRMERFCRAAPEVFMPLTDNGEVIADV